MDQRIQQVLDGELPREALNPDEAVALAETELLIGRVLRSVPTRPLPDLGLAVLKRIEGDRDAGMVPGAKPGTISRLQQFLDWLWTPRPISIQWRPAYALSALAALMLLAPFAKTLIRSGADLPALAADQVFIQFRLDAPEAKGVTLAGEFTNWKPAYTLTRTGPSAWTVVVPLQPGIHDYAFIIDGERWVPDPMTPAVADGFGGLNSRIAVLSPNHRTRL